VASDLMPAVSDSRWAAHDTTPGEIEAAMREMLKERHAENESFAPARVLNMVCIVDKAWSGEVANRLRNVGRYHASRTVVLAVDPKRDGIDAVATIASDVHPKAGEFALLRETVIVDVGEKHLAALDTIVDPLVVTDLPTVLWSPHGHPEAVDVLLSLAQVVLLDSVDEPDLHEALDRAQELSRKAYVVDLAWLRSTPWRERVAATFDPQQLRPDLRTISSITIRHHPDSTAAALLLIGWLASRLNWQPSKLISRNGALAGKAHARRQDVELRLEPEPEQSVRGLAGLTLETASGRHLALDRGPGGLRARYRNRKGDEREWTVLGASRGEAGILGEGIRQALLRDPTYTPSLEVANVLVP
jgi:glucose-6-phosphate dehydrogenase assembly protein OpcA